jgi:hypothetical protein
VPGKDERELVESSRLITRGNFRILHRVFTRIERILKINNLGVITTDVIEAARSTLAIGIE